MSKGSILAVDDEPDLLASIVKILEREDYTILTAASGEEGLLALQRDEPPDAIVSDLLMPGVGGMELLRRVRQKHPGVPVVLMTAQATLDTAIEAIREGAYDYLPKPFSRDQLLVAVKRAVGHRHLTQENRRLRAKLGAQEKKGDLGLVGDSPEIRKLLDVINRVGPTDLSVLITGESGTGKEVVARAIHQVSNRKKSGFTPVDCAAIPPSLMESELFGHEKGAFTGATSTRKGLVEHANGGTFFLDEIGELDHSIQVKLLRLLQEREYRRVGGTRLHSADLRVVAATNRDLEKAVYEEGSFREDLYHRLNVVQLELPPLRTRAQDIPLLLVHFLEIFGGEQGRPDLRFGSESLEMLCSYDWPGNVRELVNCVRYVSSLTRGDVVGVLDLPQRIRKRSGVSPGLSVTLPVVEGAVGTYSAPAIRYELGYKKSKRLWLEVFEVAYITNLLKQNDGNISHAARAAGIDRKSIQRLMKRNAMGSEGESESGDGEEL